MGETCSACKQFKMLCMCNTDALNTDFERQLARQRALIRQTSFTHPPPPLRRSPSSLTANSGSNSPAIRQPRNRKVSMGSRSGSGIFFNKGSNAELIVPHEAEEGLAAGGGISARKNIHNLHLSVGGKEKQEAAAAASSSLSCVACNRKISTFFLFFPS